MLNVEKALEGYIQATNSHGFPNVAKYLSENAVYWFQDKEYKTTSEIEAYFNNTWNLIKEERYWISNVQWLGISDTMATCLYQYHWEGLHNNKPISGKGNATNVFMKFEHEWKLIHEHLSPLP
ncbi:YybH family protein [Pseudoneobacillus sp. C159]